MICCRLYWKKFYFHEMEQQLLSLIRNNGGNCRIRRFSCFFLSYCNTNLLLKILAPNIFGARINGADSTFKLTLNIVQRTNVQSSHNIHRSFCGFWSFLSMKGICLQRTLKWNVDLGQGTLRKVSHLSLGLIRVNTLAFADQVNVIYGIYETAFPGQQISTNLCT